MARYPSNENTKILKNIIKKRYEKYVDELSQNLKNDKFLNLINLGTKDGLPDDEKLSINKNNLDCLNLSPTQNQIGLFDSLCWISRNKPEVALQFSRGDFSYYDKDRILVANNKYILDGHHRWAALSIINPSAKIPVINIDFGDMDIKRMLKIIQLAIGATYGNISFKEADEKSDIFDPGFDGKLLRDYLEKNLSLEFINNMKAGLGFNDDSEIIDYIFNNIQLLKAKKPRNSPKRKFMPQPSKSAKEAGRTSDQRKDYYGLPGEFISKLASGELNFKEPLLARESLKYLKKFDQF